MAQHCQLCFNICFSPSTAPHPAIPLTPPPPTRPPLIDSIHDIIYSRLKNTSKAKNIHIACRISYKILAICNYIGFSLAGLYIYCTIRELQCIKYFKSVLLEILNVPIMLIFVNPVSQLHFTAQLLILATRDQINW